MLHIAVAFQDRLYGGADMQFDLRGGNRRRRGGVPIGSAGSGRTLRDRSRLCPRIPSRGSVMSPLPATARAFLRDGSGVFPFSELQMASPEAQDPFHVMEENHAQHQHTTRPLGGCGGSPLLCQLTRLGKRQLLTEVSQRSETNSSSCQV